MAIGIVSDKDFYEEAEKLNGNKRPVSKTDAKVEVIEKGRGPQKEVPESLRKLIGVNAIEEGSKATKALTEYLGISSSSLSAYKNGATSTALYDRPDKELKAHITDKKVKISTRAKSRLLSTLNRITPDKLDKESAAALSGIAKNLSAVVKDIEPEPNSLLQTGNGPTYIIYAPQMKKEEAFETMTINE